MAIGWTGLAAGAALVGATQLASALRLGAPDLAVATALGWSGAWLAAADGPSLAVRPAPSGRALGAALAVAACAAGVASAAYAPYHRALPLAAGVGVAVLAGGAGALLSHARVLAPLLLPLVHPVPDALRHALAPVRGTAAAAAALLRLGGAPVTRQGSVLHVPGASVEIVDECGGVHVTGLLVALALLVLVLFPTTPRQRVLLFATAVAVGLGVNVARVAWIVFVAWRAPQALAFWEPPGAGAALFPLVAAALAGLAWAGAWRIAGRPGSGPRAQGA